MTEISARAKRIFEEAAAEKDAVEMAALAPKPIHSCVSTEVFIVWRHLQDTDEDLADSVVSIHQSIEGAIAECWPYTDPRFEAITYGDQVRNYTHMIITRYELRP